MQWAEGVGELPGREDPGLGVQSSPGGDRVLLGHLKLQEAAILPEGSMSERPWGRILQVFETRDAGLRNPRKAERGS